MRAFLIALVALLIAAPAHSHDASRPQLGEWFKGLHSSGGGPCCDNGDAYKAEVEWDAQGGRYRVKDPKGNWQIVPDAAIVKGPNLAGHAMVWWVYSNGIPYIRCFMPGTLS